MFYFWIKRHKWSVFRFLDLSVLAIIVVAMILSAGEFLGGVGWGRVTNLPWGVTLTTMLGRRHPVQIYELIFLGLILYFIKKKARNFYPQGEKPFIGFLFLIFVVLWSLSVFIVGFFVESQHYLLGLTVRQYLALLIFNTSVILFYKRGERLRRIDKRFCPEEWWRWVVNLLRKTVGLFRSQVDKLGQKS